MDRLVFTKQLLFMKKSSILFQPNPVILWGLLLFLGFSFGNPTKLAAQCNELQISYVEYEPCKYRMTFTCSADCFPEIHLVVESGVLLNVSANSADGFSVQFNGTNEYTITHAFGFMPLGTHGPLIFQLPVGVDASVSTYYNYNCGIGLGCDNLAITLNACPDPTDAAITGVKYRECNGAPYTNQALLPGWTIQLLDEAGTVLSEQITDADGAYAFYDLPAGNYTVKEVNKPPHWHSNIPLSGMSAITLNPSQHRVQNFGNCPACSCDSITMLITQQPGMNDTSTYNIVVSNNGDYCFPDIDVKIDSGLLTNYTLDAAGWQLEPIGNTLRFLPPGGYVPLGSLQLGHYSIAGAGNHVVTISSTIGNGAGQIACKRTFTFPNHPDNVQPSCCPAPFIQGPELVHNGTFSNALCGSGFISEYNCTATGTGSGNYTVLNGLQTSSANGSYWRCVGKSGNPSTDYFIVADGSTTAGQAVWKFPFTVLPNTKYSFSAYGCNIINSIYSSFPLPAIQLLIVDPSNNIVASSTPQVLPQGAPQLPNPWILLCLQWTTPQNPQNQYTLKIISTSTSSSGNDFAIDCVSFRTCAPSCCADYNTFCQNLMSAVSVSVDNSQCKATLNINNLNPCDSIQRVNWGDGNVQSGPFLDGSMTMHNYNSSGTYVITILGLEYNQNGQICFEKELRDTIQLVCDTCTCKTNSTITISSGGAVSTQKCGSHGFLPIFPCPPAPVFVSSDFGCVNANGVSCSQNQTDWNLYLNNNFVTSGTTPPNTGFVIPVGFVSAPGLYVLSLETYCPGSNDTCRCQAVWEQEACDSCCLDFDTFCQHFENNVSVQVDNLNCKASLNLGNLPPCDSVAFVNWGDGTGQQTGQYGAGAMPMHVYGHSGTYVISYAAFEYNQQGTICFEKILRDTITLICDTCSCDENSWSMEIRFGGALNQPVHCGDMVMLPTNGHFALYTNFTCQGPPECMPARVEWQLNGPNLLTGGALLATPAFTIPAVSPANFTDPGTYTLQMWGYCGSDTCHCHVTFCLPPPPPEVHDTSICRTLSSAYIPMLNCPAGCTVSQVQWFVKPCSAATWPTTPYQISPGGTGLNCSDLLLLPYKYPNETCVQVYAVLTLDPGCCVSQLVSNIATINLCDPISCNIHNLNNPACDLLPSPQALSVSLSGANCPSTIEWYYLGQVVSTTNTYQPPALGFLGNPGDCYYDHVFTVVVKGICGTSTCSTSIRIYNSKANNGDLVMNPVEATPFCPGEDATLEYTNFCSGPPKNWTWYSSQDLVNQGFSPIQGAGNMNTLWNTNQLYQTTWYMVESMNGVCPPQRDTFVIPVYAPLTITGFSATPDPCVDTYVNLFVSFTPVMSGCTYTVEWYWNGDLIGTSTTGSATAQFQFTNPGVISLAGNYYAIVKENCCGQAVATGPVFLDPTCFPVISGDCFICGYGPIMLHGSMVLPPQDPCPNTGACSFQWYEVDPATGAWNPISTADWITINHGGDFIFESNCNGCIRHDMHHVTQCSGQDCVVGTLEQNGTERTSVQLFPNPATSDVTLDIAPVPLREGRLELIYPDGRLVLSDRLQSDETRHVLSLRNVSAGMYFIRLYDGVRVVWTGKIVKGE